MRPWTKKKNIVELGIFSISLILHRFIPFPLDPHIEPLSRLIFISVLLKGVSFVCYLYNHFINSVYYLFILTKWGLKAKAFSC